GNGLIPVLSIVYPVYSSEFYLYHWKLKGIYLKLKISNKERQLSLKKKTLPSEF
ncbi:unnamed protein product, partial [marine sediment metagenome]